MNLRWLLGNFADPQYKLSRREQWEFSRLAHEKYMPGRVFFGWTALALLVPVGLILKFVLPTGLEVLGLSGRNGPYIIGILILLVLFWIWAAWVYRSIYIRPMRNAMRDKEYDVCVGCGYRLTGLGDSPKQCPECGWEVTE